MTAPAAGSVPQLVADGRQQAAQPHVARQILDQDDLARAVSQGDLPVRVLLVGAGLILGPPLADAVDEGDPDQCGGGAHDVTVEGFDDLPLGGIVPQQPVLAQAGEHPLAFDARFGTDLFDGLGEQTETLAQGHVLIREVSGGGRQVVSVDG